MTSAPGTDPIGGWPPSPLLSPKSFASCVEGYNLTTLQGRAFAFDGTVTSTAAMQPPQAEMDARAGYLAVTLPVHEWFRGGDQSSVTVDLVPGPTQGTVTSVEGASFGVGTRLLVTGEPRFGGPPLQAPVAWSCGFTRDYDQPTAAAWRQTLGEK